MSFDFVAEAVARAPAKAGTWNVSRVNHRQNKFFKLCETR